MKTIVSNSIREVNMSTFNNKSNLDYTDGDIAIANDIRKLGEYESNNTIKLDMVVIIMCVKGRLQVDINCNTYVIHPNDLLFCPPNIMLNDFQTSEDFEGKMIGLSERILQRLFHNSSDVWNKVFYICKNPIIHLEKESLNIFNYFYELVKLKINQSPRQYRKEVIHSILRAMLYEVYADLDRVVAPTEDNLIRQGDLLFRRFLKLLEENSGTRWQEFAETIQKSIPAGRAGNVEDVARAVAFLASDQAEYITGITLRVDGGMNLPMTRALVNGRQIFI